MVDHVGSVSGTLDVNLGAPRPRFLGRRQTLCRVFVSLVSARTMRDDLDVKVFGEELIKIECAHIEVRRNNAEYQKHKALPRREQELEVTGRNGHAPLAEHEP